MPVDAHPQGRSTGSTDNKNTKQKMGKRGWKPLMAAISRVAAMIVRQKRKFKRTLVCSYTSNVAFCRVLAFLSCCFWRARGRQGCRLLVAGGHVALFGTFWPFLAPCFLARTGAAGWKAEARGQRSEARAETLPGGGAIVVSG